MKKILTIAGSDCSGGAGIQADIKTITMHGMYAMSAITALTAQNTTGVYGIMNSSADFLKNQIDCIFNDIRPDAVKIGMVSDVEIIEAIAEKLKEYKAVNIVADPVMVATSGSRLISEDATDALMTKLLPLADIITPNLAEAEVLTGMKITTREEMERAAKVLSDKLPSTVGIVIKGGHLDDTADDLVFIAVNAHWEPHEQQLPEPPAGMHWMLTLHTSAQNAFAPDIPFDGYKFNLDPRSVAVVTAKAN